MGPVAWFEARKVSGLQVTPDGRTYSVALVEGVDGSQAIDALVERFTNLFGRAGHEVCKEAVGALIAELQPNEIPSSLRSQAGVPVAA